MTAWLGFDMLIVRSTFPNICPGLAVAGQFAQRFPQSLCSSKLFQKRTMASLESRRPQVFVTRQDIPPIGIELLKRECDLSTWDQPGPVPRDVLLRNVVGKDALFCTLVDKIDDDVLEKAGPSLKTIGTMSVGYDHIDLAACKKRGIRIGYTPEVLTDATAELTVALLLATTRRLFEASKEVYNGGWKSWAPTWMCGQGLKGSTVGIVGFGRIGQEVAKRIVPFKPARILYTGRTERKQEAREVNAEYVGFDCLLKEADVVVALCALTPDTVNLFNKDTFSKMKPTAVFINASRGAVVDQKALYEALRDKVIATAGLDVTTPEPLPVDDPLTTLSNIVILPHIGSADINTRIEMSRITACNILQGMKGEEMIAEVNYEQ